MELFLWALSDLVYNKLTLKLLQWILFLTILCHIAYSSIRIKTSNLHITWLYSEDFPQMKPTCGRKHLSTEKWVGCFPWANLVIIACPIGIWKTGIYHVKGFQLYKHPTFKLHQICLGCRLWSWHNAPSCLYSRHKHS